MKILFGSSAVCVAAVTVFLACGSRDNAEENSVITLHPLDETEYVSDLSGFVKKIEYVPLEEDEKMMFSDIHKALIDKAGNIHILDYGGRIVSIRQDGSFYGKVAGRGRAGNEYLTATDIALTDDELLVLDGNAARFFALDCSGLTKTVSFKSVLPYDAVAPRGEDGLYAFSAYPSTVSGPSEDEYLLSEVGIDGSTVSRSINREDCTFSIGNISQSCGNVYYLRPQNIGNVFYRLDDEGPEPEYRIDFGKENIPERYYYDEAGEDISKYMTAQYYKLPMDLHATDSHLYFHCSGPFAEDVCFLYNVGKGKGIRWKNAGGDAVMPVLCSDMNWFYLILRGFEEHDETVHGPLYNCIVRHLVEEDEPSSGSYLVKVEFGI